MRTYYTAQGTIFNIYLVITYNGKEYEMEKKIYIYTQLNHFAVYLKHCKSTILQFLKGGKNSKMEKNCS